MKKHRRLPLCSTPRSNWSAAGVGLWVSSSLAVLSSSVASTASAQAGTPSQRTDAPVAPSSAVSSIGSATTLSVMGLTGIPSNAEGAMPQREVLFTGVSTSAGRIGGVRLTAIGTGYFTARDAVGNKGRRKARWLFAPAAASTT